MDTGERSQWERGHSGDRQARGSSWLLIMRLSSGKHLPSLQDVAAFEHLTQTASSLLCMIKVSSCLFWSHTKTRFNDLPSKYLLYLYETYLKLLFNYWKKLLVTINKMQVTDYGIHTVAGLRSHRTLRACCWASYQQWNNKTSYSAFCTVLMLNLT